MTRPTDDPRFPEAVLQVTAWPDPVLDRLGHDPRSFYAERFWLPVLGPSCLLLVRRLAADLERVPEGFTVDCATWARELGIGMKGGRHGPFWRALDRACRFGAVRRAGPRLTVRRRLPPLTARQVERLPESLHTAHGEWLDERLQTPRRATVSRWVPHPSPRRAPRRPPVDPDADPHPRPPAPSRATTTLRDRPSPGGRRQNAPSLRRTAGTVRARIETSTHNDQLCT